MSRFKTGGMLGSKVIMGVGYDAKSNHAGYKLKFE